MCVFCLSLAFYANLFILFSYIFLGPALWKYGTQEQEFRWRYHGRYCGARQQYSSPRPATCQTQQIRSRTVSALKLFHFCTVDTSLHSSSSGSSVSLHVLLKMQICSHASNNTVWKTNFKEMDVGMKTIVLSEWKRGYLWSTLFFMSSENGKAGKPCEFLVICELKVNAQVPSADWVLF